MNLTKLTRYFDLAKRLSERSNHHQHRLGCVIVSGKGVVGMGWNLQKTHPLSPHPYHHIHAEFMAVLSAGLDREVLNGATCYVYRETKNGTPALAKPCPTCMSMLKSYGIRVVTYTTKCSYETQEIYTLPFSK